MSKYYFFLLRTTEEARLKPDCIIGDLDSVLQENLEFFALQERVHLKSTFVMLVGH